jgi:hypothetical protein
MMQLTSDFPYNLFPGFKPRPAKKWVTEMCGDFLAMQARCYPNRKVYKEKLFPPIHVGQRGHENE